MAPRLRSHIVANAHIFRGERWYILSDSTSGRHIRFNATAYEFIGRLDGERSVDEIHQEISTQLGDDAPDHQEIVTLLTRLYISGVLHSSVAPDVEELFKRYQVAKRMDRMRRWINPLALRFPLLDPDQILNRYAPFVRPLFSATGVSVWLGVVLLGLLTLFMNFSELGESVGRNIISPGNLVILFLLFPVMKALHEFAHAFAVKIWGGEVHEMGITLLVLMPVPYVDASAAWSFQEKYKRVLVGAAGMIVELFIAALALIVWAIIEPGAMRDAALSAFFIGSLSTLFFNGNPLLRFDGYYILQDLIEIPNLYTRSSRYILYQFKTRVLGVADESPVTAKGEEFWFAGYGILAWIYRMAIMLTIATFLASKYLLAGVLLATWSIVLMIVLPLYRGIRYLLTSPELQSNRAKTLSTLALGCAAAVLITVAIPFRLHTVAHGVVWVPDQAHLYAGTAGFVNAVNAEPGDFVRSGSELITLHSPEIDARNDVLQAQLRELEARQESQRFDDPVQADQTREEIAAVTADIEALTADREGLKIVGNVPGNFVVDEERKLLGSYVNKGDALGYIVNPDQLIVRLVVPQSTIGLVREKIDHIQVRLAERPQQAIAAELLRQTPSGSTLLPNRALGAAGGGLIPVEADDKSGRTANNPVFQIDLKLAREPDVAGIGTRAFVRFNHGRESLARRWLRSARQLLLGKLSL